MKSFCPVFLTFQWGNRLCSTVIRRDGYATITVTLVGDSRYSTSMGFRFDVVKCSFGGTVSFSSPELGDQLHGTLFKIVMGVIPKDDWRRL